MSIWHKLKSSERKEYHWENASIRWSCRKLCTAFSSLVIDARVPWMGGAIPGLVVPGSIRAQDGRGTGSKPVSSSLQGLCTRLTASRFLLCVSSCPDFFQGWTMMWMCKPNKPFPTCLWLRCLITVIAVLTSISLHPDSSKNKVQFKRSSLSSKFF